MASADNGYYKLFWGERIGFNSGELAQNLIYQTISIWLLFFYNNVFGLDAGVVAPGLVLAWVGFKAGASAQTPLAEQGILWLVTLIPATLFVMAIFVIGKYELSDEKMDEINAAITRKNREN